MDAGVRCAQMDVWFWARLVCEECALVCLCFDRPEGLIFVVFDTPKESSEFPKLPFLQADLAINCLPPSTRARPHANSPRDVCATHATRAGHRMSLSMSQHRSDMPIPHTSTPPGSHTDMITKVRKNR